MLYLNSNSANLCQSTNGQDAQIPGPLTLNTGDWNFVTAGCSQWGIVNMICFTKLYYPVWGNYSATETVQFTSATAYTESATDGFYLGDGECSFVGFMRHLSIVVGTAMTFSDPGMNCPGSGNIIAGLYSPITLVNYPAPSAGSCGAGYYPDYAFGRCSKCDTRCFVCTTGSNTNCTACNSPYTLIGGACSCQDSDYF